MASPALTGRRDRSAVLRDGPLARRPRRGAPPRSRQAHPPTSPSQSPIRVPPRPIPAKGRHPVSGPLLPGPVQYHRRRMIRYCLRWSQLPASRTRHHPAGPPRPAHRPRTPRPRTPRPGADRYGRPRTRRSASSTGYHAAGAPRPAHRPRTYRPRIHRPRTHWAGRPRTRRSAHPSRTRTVRPPPPRRAQPCRRSRIRGAGRPGPPPPDRPPGRGFGLPPRLRSRWPGPRPAT